MVKSDKGRPVRREASNSSLDSLFVKTNKSEKWAKAKVPVRRINRQIKAYEPVELPIFQIPAKENYGKIRARSLSVESVSNHSCSVGDYDLIVM